MKWIAIAGGWRKTNLEVEQQVRTEVREVLSQDYGIVSGGALGVDYIATEEALCLNADNNQLKIIIPSSLEIYCNHYQQRAEEKKITFAQAEMLISQMEKVKKNDCLIEGTATVIDREAYFNRITKIVESADELIAFHINQTAGTQDTLNKAYEKGIPVKVFIFSID